MSELWWGFKNAKNAKKINGNIFKKNFENRRVAVQVQNLATESFKFIIIIIDSAFERLKSISREEALRKVVRLKNTKT